jgi:hypothetical protein
MMSKRVVVSALVLSLLPLACGRTTSINNENPIFSPDGGGFPTDFGIGDGPGFLDGDSPYLDGWMPPPPSLDAWPPPPPPAWDGGWPPPPPPGFDGGWPPPPQWDGGWPPPPPGFDGGWPPPPTWDGGWPPPPQWDGGWPPPPTWDGGWPPPWDGGAPDVDLVVTHFDATVNGSTVTYQLVVCNYGTDEANNFYVDIYYNRKSAPNTGDFGPWYENIGSLPANDCAKFSHDRTATADGTYNSWAQVDADGIVSEFNEQNNIGGPVSVTVGTTTQTVDLMVNSFTATTTASGEVNYSLYICNVGTGPANASHALVYYHRLSPPAEGDTGDYATSIPALAGGQCHKMTVQRSGTPPGTYYSYLVVDAYGAISETNETNNSQGPIQVVVDTPPPPTGDPDLTVQQFYAKVSGDSVYYYATICNYGGKSSGAFETSLHYNATTDPGPLVMGDAALQTTSLGAGKCTTWNWIRSSTPVGMYFSWVYVDTGDKVIEANETNNSFGPQLVTVQDPVPPPPPMNSCNTVCSFAIYTCSIYTSNEFAQCDTWCKGLTTTAMTCVEGATKSGDCTAFKTCSTPPLPPPPPPPGTCADVCTYLTGDCGYPQSQYWPCIGACETLAADKLTCVQDAVKQNQCTQVLYCMI